MRRPVDAERLRRFMADLGEQAGRDVRIYLTGGATAVLLGWRESTIDIDIKMEPETDQLFRELPKLKDRLEVNVELAAPDQFIPEIPGWRERSSFIAREGSASFHHYDFYAQALAKTQRGHETDLADVRAMFRLGLIDRQNLLHRFKQIEPQLYRYPAVDPKAFRRAVEEAVRE